MELWNGILEWLKLCLELPQVINLKVGTLPVYLGTIELFTLSRLHHPIIIQTVHFQQDSVLLLS